MEYGMECHAAPTAATHSLLSLTRAQVTAVAIRVDTPPTPTPPPPRPPPAPPHIYLHQNHVSGSGSTAPAQAGRQFQPPPALTSPCTPGAPSRTSRTPVITLPGAHPGVAPFVDQRIDQRIVLVSTVTDFVNGLNGEPPRGSDGTGASAAHVPMSGRALL